MEKNIFDIQLVDGSQRKKRKQNSSIILQRSSSTLYHTEWDLIQKCGRTVDFLFRVCETRVLFNCTGKRHKLVKFTKDVSICESQPKLNAQNFITIPQLILFTDPQKPPSCQWFLLTSSSLINNVNQRSYETNQTRPYDVFKTGYILFKCFTSSETKWLFCFCSSQERNCISKIQFTVLSLIIPSHVL